MLGALLLAAGLVAADDPFVAGRIEASSAKLPQCLSRFLDYPPGPGRLGFPQCLWTDPFPANPDFWLKGVDFTCVSPWNGSHEHRRAGTAVSRRHIVFAKHFPLAEGTHVTFVGERGETSRYRIENTWALASCDIMIGLLDGELSSDIRPAKVLPRDFAAWLPAGSRWPVVTFNQREQAYLSEAVCVPDGQTGAVSLRNGKATADRWSGFGGRIIGGDSGNPAFLLYRGQPILLYCLFSGGVGHGPMIHEHRREIQQAMDDLCPGYTLEEFDFAAFQSK